MKRNPADHVPFNLASLMRVHKVTIRDLSERTGATMKRIRQIRGMTSVSYTTYCDYTQAVTGVNVFSRAHYDRLQGHTS
jgi:hypothetical protein